MNHVLRVVSGPEGLGEKITFGSDRPFVVGRERGSDAVFSGDVQLSSTHFSIVSNSQEIYLTDLASTNGTYLNGERVYRAQVYPGDQIRAGRTIFEVVQLPSSPAPPFATAPQIDTDYLTITSDSGEERVLRSGEQLTIGRTDMSAWSFPHDAKMSSEHFLVESQGKKWEIRDLRSTNGTFLNQKRLDASAIQSGDIVLAGSTKFTFTIVSPVKHLPAAEYEPPTSLPKEQTTPPSYSPKADALKNSPLNSPLNSGIRETTDWIASPSAFTTVDNPDRDQPQKTSVAPPSIAKDNFTPTTVSPAIDVRKPATPAPVRFRVTLHCLTDPTLSADYEQGQEVFFGRESHNDFAFPNDNLISGSHARLRVLDKQVVLQDLDSTNGTLVNGTRIRDEVLYHGGRFTVGKQRFRIGFVGEKLEQDPIDLAPMDVSDNDSKKSTPSSNEEIPQSQSVGVKPKIDRLPIVSNSVLPIAEIEIPFEAFPCGSGLMLFGGCIPSFDPIDIARRLTLATPGWLIQPMTNQSKSNNNIGIDGTQKSVECELAMDLLSTTDPSWMIPWSKQWGTQKTLVVYSRSEPTKIKQTMKVLCEALHAAPNDIPPHDMMFEFFANRLSDTVFRIFSPLDAVLIELYGGKQWAYLAPKDMEFTLGQLRFRKKHRW